MLLPGKAGGTAAVRRTLASTICRIADPTLVARPRQLRDASTVMRFRPAHQSMINRRHDGRASCPAQQSLMPLLPIEPRIYAPATWKGGHESGRYPAQRATLDPLADLQNRYGGTHPSGRSARRRTAGECQVASLAANRRPDRSISRSSGLRYGLTSITTAAVIERSRTTAARASSMRPRWA